METLYNTVSDIRKTFANKLINKDFVVNDTGSLSGSKTIEIIGASFIANEDRIFGTPNKDYIKRELAWYLSESLNVNDIPGKTPAIWNAVATRDGFINSNYGYLLNSSENYSQARNVIDTLSSSPESRRAIAIYTRPTMHIDFNRHGMQDFCCTNTVQYLIRENKLDVIVNMRSNDAVFGYLNDYAWQYHVQGQFIILLNGLNGTSYTRGDIHWQVGSLHVYEKHFYHIKNSLNLQ